MVSTGYLQPADSGFNMFQPNHPGLGTTQIWSLLAHPQLTSVKCRWFSAENAGIPQGASPMVCDMVPLVWWFGSRRHMQAGGP